LTTTRFRSPIRRITSARIVAARLSTPIPARGDRRRGGEPRGRAAAQRLLPPVLRQGDPACPWPGHA
jgi:hypothetical protein